MIISFGKCYRSYFFILGSALCTLLSFILLGAEYNNKVIGLFGFYPTFTKFSFIQRIIIYFGFIIFGIIFSYFKKIKKDDQNEIKVNNSQRNEIYIYNYL